MEYLIHPRDVSRPRKYPDTAASDHLKETGARKTEKERCFKETVARERVLKRQWHERDVLRYSGTRESFKETVAQ